MIISVLTNLFFFTVRPGCFYTRAIVTAGLGMTIKTGTPAFSPVRPVISGSPAAVLSLGIITGIVAEIRTYSFPHDNRHRKRNQFLT